MRRNMIFYGWFFPVLFLGSLCAKAQDNNGENRRGLLKNTRDEKGEIHLRWYPLGLVNTSDFNLTLGAEYGYAANKSLALDVGYIFASIYANTSGDITPASGILTRLNHRWYLDKTRNSLFLEGEAAMKWAKYQSENQWVGRGVVAGVPAYQQLMPVTSVKQVFTLDAKIGEHLSFSRNSRLGFEWTVGLGIRYRNYYPDLPADAMINNTDGWGFDPWNYGETWLPDFQANFRLTWQLRP